VQEFEICQAWTNIYTKRVAISTIKPTQSTIFLACGAHQAVKQYSTNPLYLSSVIDHKLFVIFYLSKEYVSARLTQAAIVVIQKVWIILRLQFLYAALSSAILTSRDIDVIPILERLGRYLLRHRPHAYGAAAQGALHHGRSSD
jgi:hypothetical protein